MPNWDAAFQATLNREPINPRPRGYAEIFQAGAEHTEWLIVELDRCATDMVEAVQSSYDYLVGEGLARGSK